MGKGKRSRENNAADLFNAAAGSKKSKKSGGMNVWTKVLLISVALIIVASIALTYIGTSGILLRAPKAFKTENFEINGAMMQYIFATQYSTLSSNYQTQLKNMGLDTSKSLREQQYTAKDSTLITSLYGDDVKLSGTWFDVFWEITMKYAKQTLAYCEAAKASGITLTAEEKASIDKNIDAIATMATLYGFPNTKSYINAMYGSSVTKADIRDVMELSMLSDKYYQAETKKILEGITDEQVKKFFEENKSDYLFADYYTFTLQAVKDAADANDNDKTKAEKQAKFEAEVQAVKTLVENISKATDIKTIEEYMTAYWIDANYDAYLNNTQKELLKKDKDGKSEITDADVPTLKDNASEAEKAAHEALLAANKEKVVAAVKDAIKNNTADADLKALGTAAYDKVLTAVRDKLIATVKKNIDAMLSEEVLYNTNNDAAKWIFSADRKEGDTNSFGAEKFDVTKDNSYKVTVYRISKPMYIIEEKVKEFGHILIDEGNFKSDKHDGHDHKADDKDAIAKENDAKAKAEAERLLAEFNKGNKTKEAFEALAKDKNQDSNVFYADTQPGQMVDEMDEFLFGKDTKINDTKVIKTTYGYHVTWLISEGKEVWFVNAKNNCYTELVKEWKKNTEAKYTSIANKNLASMADRIDA